MPESDSDLVTIHSKTPLGRILITPNARAHLTNFDIHNALSRHALHDWGDLDERDRKANERALKDGSRLLSRYTSEKARPFWIITEADREHTTILFPEDY
jgi:hypothetical protein